MSAAESLGSHQLNSFAAFLEEKLHTSSESSIVQIPQLKKMANEKRPQKGGKRPEVNTAFEIPEDIYAGYCTPPEEDKNQRKVRIQKIERRWACSDPTRMDQVSVLKCHPWIGMLTHTVLEDL